MTKTVLNQFEQAGNIDPSLIDIPVERWQEVAKAVLNVEQTPNGA
jgi:hypothetical protein